MKYAVCFAGARDGYEVAIAFQETGTLERFVTDLYLSRGPALVLAKVGLVRAATPRHARALRGAVICQYPFAFLLARLGQSPADQAYLAEAFANVCTSITGGIFSYAGYALEAFERAAPFQPKVLFQYHPHRAMEAKLLAVHAESAVGRAFASESSGKEALDERNRSELAVADTVICASDFTRQSVLALGIDRAKVHVVPYGLSRSFDALDIVRSRSTSGPCRFLFVGTGLFRKGVHLLLAAWRNARLNNAELLIVWRTPDQKYAEKCRELAGCDVKFEEDLRSRALEDRYLSAHVFVFPSLCEGFGHVIGEALAAGCFTIATDRTCLPDLAPDPSHARIIRGGEIEPLVEALRVAHALHQNGKIDHQAIARSGAVHSWAKFRSGIREAAALGKPAA